VIWKFGFGSRGFSLATLGLVNPKFSFTKSQALSWFIAGVLATLVLFASLFFTAGYAWLGEKAGLHELLLPPEIPQDIFFEGIAGIFNYEGIAVWTPITEELLFRGFIFAGLATRLKPAWAIIISGGVFSLFHVFPGVLIPIFVTGVLLAWLYHRTGSLWPCIAAHAGQNAMAITVTMLGLQAGP
jgi:membrane protease YdiL (CAAX protease family)